MYVPLYPGGHRCGRDWTFLPPLHMTLVPSWGWTEPPLGHPLVHQAGDAGSTSGSPAGVPVGLTGSSSGVWWPRPTDGIPGEPTVSEGVRISGAGSWPPSPCPSLHLPSAPADSPGKPPGLPPFDQWYPRGLQEIDLILLDFKLSWGMSTKQGVVYCSVSGLPPRICVICQYVWVNTNQLTLPKNFQFSKLFCF